MSVLVTGASGFIGGSLLRRLTENGATVHALSRGVQSRGDVVWHRVDLADAAAVKRLIDQVAPDLVYHLAGRVTGSTDVAEVRKTLDVSVLGTISILEAAAEGRCGRVILTGSDKELGVGDGCPASPYAAAKVAATTYARMFHEVFGVSTVNLRAFMVYGPGQADTSKLVPYAITSLLAGVDPELTSGARRFDWVYVDDVVDALLAAATAEAGDDGAPIDVGSGELTSIRELVDQIARIVGGDAAPRFGALPDRPPEPGFAARLERARTLLGWEPRTTLRAGIEQTVAWYDARLRESREARG